MLLVLPTAGQQHESARVPESTAQPARLPTAGQQQQQQSARLPNSTEAHQAAAVGVGVGLGSVPWRTNAAEASPAPAEREAATVAATGGDMALVILALEGALAPRLQQGGRDAGTELPLGAVQRQRMQYWSVL